MWTQTSDALVSPGDCGDGEVLNHGDEIQTGAAVVTRAAARRKDTVRPLVIKSPGDLTNSEEVRREVESDPSLQRVRKCLLEGSVVHMNYN